MYMYIYIYICIYTYMYMYLYICVCVRMYIITTPLRLLFGGPYDMKDTFLGTPNRPLDVKWAAEGLQISYLWEGLLPSGNFR